MKSQLWIALIAVLPGFAACNSTVGECWLRGQGDESGGVGSGVLVPGGTGDYGDTPPDPRSATIPEADCNSATQSPCTEKCLSDYESEATKCGKIEDDAQRKTCQDGAYALYKSCKENCQQTSSCRKDCEDKAEACEAECRKLPEDDKAGRQKCWIACNNAYAECIKKCKD
jgi:hypothetical protein